MPILSLIKITRKKKANVVENQAIKRSLLKTKFGFLFGGFFFIKIGYGGRFYKILLFVEGKQAAKKFVFFIKECWMMFKFELQELCLVRK